MQLLLDKGADPNMPDPCGKTPLHCAFEWFTSGEKFVALLLDRGADPILKDNRGRTPLNMIGSSIHYAGSDSLEIQKVKLILSHIGTKKKIPSVTSTLHQREIGIGSGRLLTPLIIDEKDDSGETPLHRALKYPSKELVTLLLDAGARILPDNNGNTPIDLAQNHPEILQIFQDRGLA